MNYWKAYLTRFTCAMVDGVGVTLGMAATLYIIAQFI